MVRSIMSIFNIFHKNEFPQRELTLSEQLAMVEPMPEQIRYKDQYRRKNDPLRIGREFRQLTVFPNDFWEKLEAFIYEKHYGNIADYDMDDYIGTFFSAYAAEGRSLDEWRIVLLAIRNFYRLNVWTSQYVARCGVSTFKPALHVICKNQTDIYIPLIQFICDREIMDCIGTWGAWAAAWEIAHSLSCPGTLLCGIAEGNLQAAYASSYQAEYVARAALLFAQSGDKNRAKDLFDEALGYANADKTIYAMVHNGEIAESFSPQDRDVKTILSLMKEAGLIKANK
jgi:hypothetical protein